MHLALTDMLAPPRRHLVRYGSVRPSQQSARVVRALVSITDPDDAATPGCSGPRNPSCRVLAGGRGLTCYAARSPTTFSTAHAPGEAEKQLSMRCPKTWNITVRRGVLGRSPELTHPYSPELTHAMGSDLGSDSGFEVERAHQAQGPALSGLVDGLAEAGSRHPTRHPAQGGARRRSRTGEAAAARHERSERPGRRRVRRLCDSSSKCSTQVTPTVALANAGVVARPDNDDATPQRSQRRRPDRDFGQPGKREIRSAEPVALRR
jgi:hypothetical protein